MRTASFESCCNPQPYQMPRGHEQDKISDPALDCASLREGPEGTRRSGPGDKCGPMGEISTHMLF